MSITLLRYTSLNSASERASKKRPRNKPMFCDVTGWTVERHAIYFQGFSMAGCDEMEAYRYTNDDSETDSDDNEIAGAVLERGEAAESDDYSHNVQPYRFEPCDARWCWQRDRCWRRELTWRVRRTRNMLANKWRQRHECARQIYSGGKTREWRVWRCQSYQITS